MKKLTAIAFFALTFALAFYACNDLSTGLSTSNSGATNSTTTAMIIHPNYDIQLATYSGISLDNPASFNPSGLGDFFPPDQGFGHDEHGGLGGPGHSGHGMDSLNKGDTTRRVRDSINVGPHKRPMPLPFIPRNFGLDSNEVLVISGFAKVYFDCVKAVMDADRPQMEAILKVANDSRKAIIDSLRKGLLDRKTAHTELIALDKATHDQLKTISQDPALCVCLKTYLDAVRSALTPDQQTAWDAYIATLKGFCFTTN
ncbi:MAG: hypothetical protein NT007_03125 [Candidatus Kapabacteria bacterium]|nr:hypothetical protein [Candidatus Kapabacteria bacterium]